MRVSDVTVWRARIGALILLLLATPAEILAQGLGVANVPLGSMAQTKAPNLSNVGIDQRLDA